jgi:hypothetical protein
MQRLLEVLSYSHLVNFCSFFDLVKLFLLLSLNHIPNYMHIFFRLLSEGFFPDIFSSLLLCFSDKLFLNLVRTVST